MQIYFSLPRLLVCVTGVLVFGCSSYSVQLQCNRKVDVKSYCQIIEWGIFWTTYSRNFNLQGVTLRHNGTLHELHLNSKEEKLLFDYYNDSDIVNARKIEYQVQRFLQNQDERWLDIKSGSVVGAAIISILGLFLVYNSLFVKCYRVKSGTRLFADDPDNV
jgi:translation initiation factor RLI1